MANSKILTAEQEKTLRQPIEEYVGKIQKEIDELRKDGTAKVIMYQSRIENVKRDKTLSKGEKDSEIASCQNERSQHQNKDKAMQMLKAKLYLLKQQENAEKEAGIRGEVKEIGWGNQIRSYILQPYTLVKDHRTNAESGNAQAVLDGNIDLFLGEYLKWIHRTPKTT